MRQQNASSRSRKAEPALTKELEHPAKDESSRPECLAILPAVPCYVHAETFRQAAELRILSARTIIELANNVRSQSG
jgi:hypothetical protein